MTMFDDHAGVRAAVSGMGIACIDPLPINANWQ
jgi:hypothetical protein